PLRDGCACMRQWITQQAKPTTHAGGEAGHGPTPTAPAAPQTQPASAPDSPPTPPRRTPPPVSTEAGSASPPQHPPPPMRSDQPQHEGSGNREQGLRGLRRARDVGSAIASLPKAGLHGDHGTPRP